MHLSLRLKWCLALLLQRAFYMSDIEHGGTVTVMQVFSLTVMSEYDDVGKE